jgi:hypothetical protein
MWRLHEHRQKECAATRATLTGVQCSTLPINVQCSNTDKPMYSTATDMALTQWRKASQRAQTETRWAVRKMSSPLAAGLAEAEERVPRLVFLSGHRHGGLKRREVVVKHKRSSVLVVDLRANKSANTTSPSTA